MKSPEPHMFFVYFVCFVVLLLFTSCKVGPNYHRPPLPVPDAYKSAAPHEQAEIKLGLDWWRLFNDPDLNALEEEALRSNPGLQAAMARVSEARETVAAVRSQFYPVVTLNPSVTRTRAPAIARGGTAGATGLGVGTNGVTPRPSPTPAIGVSFATSPTPTPGVSGSGPTAVATPSVIRTTLYQIPFDLSYEVDIWGRVRRSYEAAQAQARVSAYDMQVVRQTLLADVAQNYFNLRSFEIQDRIIDENVELYREQIALTQEQFNAGLVSEVNVLQTRTLLYATLAQEIEVRRQRADLEHAIAILIGRPPAEFSLKTRITTSTVPLIPTGLPSDLLRRRPDVAEAEQNLAAASAQIGVAKANFFPAVRLTGLAGFESTKFNQALEWRNRVWSIGSNITAPIFEGGLLKANLAQAWAKYQEELANYKTALLGAFRDVEDSLTDVHLRGEEAQAQRRAVTAARQTLDLTQTQYRTGLASYLQVIDADRSLIVNELSAEQNRNQQMLSAVLLIKALGGGWEAPTTSTMKNTLPKPAPIPPNPALPRPVIRTVSEN